MISRRGFFGALAGSAALAATNVGAGERSVPGWVIEWGGWREPSAQYVKFGFWMARRDPMPTDYDYDEYPYYYSTTLGIVEGARKAYVLDVSIQDRDAPLLPHEPAVKFEAAKAWARERLIKKLESL